MQGGGNGEGLCRARRQNCGDAVLLVSAFEQCPGQFLDKQGDAIGTLDDRRVEPSVARQVRRLADDVLFLRRHRDLGIARVTVRLPAAKSDAILPILDRWTGLIRQVGARSA